MPSDTKAISFLLALLLLFLPLSCETDDPTPETGRKKKWFNYKCQRAYLISWRCCGMRQSIPESFECDVVRLLFFFFIVSALLCCFRCFYCIVWMDVSISAMRVIFGETYNLLSSVGPGCASVVSEATWTLQRRLAPLPLCPACPWSTSVFCDQRGFSPYLATARPLFSQSGKRPGCSS